MAEPSSITSSHVAALCVVEGDARERRTLTTLLAQIGAPVQSYANAEDLLAGLDRLELALLVANVRLPGIGGIELLRRLREDGFETPMILISGEGDIEMAVDAMRAGAADFMEKPIIDRILLRRAKSALDSAAAATH